MKNNDLFIYKNRATVSLGRLNEQRYCPFTCAFCSAQDEDTEQYLPNEISDIINFLESNKDKFDIVYVSGNTDSFAPPRTDRGIELLDQIAKKIDTDILFTTRTTFSPEQLQKLKDIVTLQKAKNKELFSAISITRYSEKNEYLEPYPNPTPDERIKTLIALKKLGSTTVLALRPFLPMVSLEEYMTILDKCGKHTDIVLGCNFHFKDTKSQSLQRVFKGNPTDEENIKLSQVDYFNKKGIWNNIICADYESKIREKCEQLGPVFSMSSIDAITEYKEQKNLEIVN